MPYTDLLALESNTGAILINVRGIDTTNVRYSR